MDNKQYFVYIMTNAIHTVLYTGITSNLPARVYQHKTKVADGFTKKYSVNILVYFEATDSAYAAISREKQIKAGSRQKKIDLINKLNPGWRELSEDF